MPAPTLLALALKKAISNVDDIEYFPEVPYSTLRPILRVIKTADQLHKIELSSPQIIGENSDIWKNLIRRDTDIDFKDIPEPKDPSKWWKVHRKLVREGEVKYERSAAALKAAMDRHQADKESYSTETLSQRVAKLPKQSFHNPRATRPKKASGSGFLSRVREHSKEKASLRKTANILKGQPASINKIKYAPNGLSGKLPEAKYSSHGKRSYNTVTPRTTSRHEALSDQHSKALPSRPSNISLSGKRQLGPSSNVFGPPRKRY